MKKNKILLLSGTYGEGHQQAARALIQSINCYRTNTESTLLDFMELTHPYLHSVSRYIFLQGIKKVPSAYGYIYRKTRYRNSLTDLIKQFNRMGIRNLVRLIQEMEPELIISTFPPAAGPYHY